MDLTQTPVSLILFIATIGFSLYGLYANENFIPRFWLNPWRVVRHRQWYLLLTSGFLHADLMHLMFNMLSYYFFAFNLEIIVGPWNFLIIYIGSMVLSNISTIIKQRDNPYYNALGASGAISGVLFSFILFVPTSKIYLYFAIGIPAPIFAVLYLAYCYYAAKHAQDLINHDAHLWGALAGVVITILLLPGVITYFINQVF